MRRLALTNHSDRPREIEVTSYAEIVLAAAADDLAHPAFGKLFVETEYLPERTALLCSRRPRSTEEAALWAVHVLSLEGRTQGPRRVGDGPRALPRPRAARPRTRRRSTAARCRAPPASSSIPSSACGCAFASPPAASCGCPSPPAWRSPGTPPWRSRRSTTSRARPRAPSPSPSRTRRARCATSGSPSEAGLLFERLASRVLYADGSLRAAPEVLARSELGQEGLWPHGISGDLPDPAGAGGGGGRPAPRARGPAGAGVLAAQGAASRRGDPERAPRQLPRRDARRADRPARQRPLARLEPPARRRLPAARRPHGRGRARPARGRRAGRAQGDRGELAAQLEHAHAHWPEPESADVQPSRPPEPETAARGSQRAV